MTFENRGNIPEKLLKPYNASEIEKSIYKTWEESGYFNPDVCIERGVTDANAEPFTIMLPPPNVTGTLHMGHAFGLTVQDIAIRFNRMIGKKTLWVPGTDHAAIATQSKVEKEIQKKEGLSRHDLGREEMLRRIDEFAQNSHDTIVSQIRSMGASCDWSREAFTMDEKRNLAVRTIFKNMYDDGLIYRGNRIVNWDPKGQTTIADDEIVYEERKAKLYTFKYSKDFPISISTTRPETKVGDTAVAVHPDDARYKQYVGLAFEIADFCGVPLTIRVIADEMVEPDFGTGALGVTPAHSQIDWEIADRHDLPRIQVINEYAKMTVGNENILGKKTTEAREAVVEWLREQGLLENEEEVTQNISTAERTSGIVEPLPKLQWFIDVNKKIPSKGKSLKEIMRDTVAGGDVKILPDHFNKTYFHWIDNLRDWCISRQIWYGHRIPVWYDKQGTIHLQKNMTLHLVRHGESEANRDNVFGGGTFDTHLSETGIAQAKELGKKMKGQKIDGIISSNQIRARKTAEIICDELGLSHESIIIIPELHEICTDMDGRAKTAEFPTMRSLVKAGKGETLVKIQERADICLEKIGELPEGTYIISGHGAFNSCLQARMQKLEGNDLFDFWNNIGVPKNASYRTVHFLVDPKGENLIQDSDTLDTWFSSGLWTFSTLGWPDKTPDFETYHPTQLIVPAYEILFFWVARMIMMTGYALDTIPFETVYLTGVLRDNQGRKLSKSLGNGGDPIEVGEKFGTDAVRMSLIVSNSPGIDSKIDENKIKAYSKFANKIWNATRFVMEQTHDLDLSAKPEYDAEDQQSIDELNTFIKEITAEMKDYKFYLVSEKLYHYFWDTFASNILERSKTKIAESNSTSAKWTLYTHLVILLKALHPFMPFITEEIWNLLPMQTNDKKLLIIESWPTSD